MTTDTACYCVTRFVRNGRYDPIEKEWRPANVAVYDVTYDVACKLACWMNDWRGEAWPDVLYMPGMQDSCNLKNVAPRPWWRRLGR